MKYINELVAIIGLGLTLAHYNVNAGEYTDYHRIGIGLHTEHFVGDCECYNEKNELVSYDYIDEDKTVYTVARFRNSHSDVTHMVGMGKEWIINSRNPRIDAGFTLGVMRGYKNHIVNVDHWSPAPVLYAVYEQTLSVKVMGPVVNVGYTFVF